MKEIGTDVYLGNTNYYFARPLKTVINKNNDNYEKYDPVSPLRGSCNIDVVISTNWSI